MIFIVLVMNLGGVWLSQRKQSLSSLQALALNPMASYHPTRRSGVQIQVCPWHIPMIILKYEAPRIIHKRVVLCTVLFWSLSLIMTLWHNVLPVARVTSFLLTSASYLPCTLSLI